MADDADLPEPARACVQEVGSKRTPRACGDPARYGLLGPRADRVIPMCEFHAWLAMDRAGFEIAVEWPTSRGHAEQG